ncbi:MAG: hypothetical protein ABI068_05535, partial [Ktedonobacterales bacterium]
EAIQLAVTPGAAWAALPDVPALPALALLARRREMLVSATAPGAVRGERGEAQISAELAVLQAKRATLAVHKATLEAQRNGQLLTVQTLLADVGVACQGNEPFTELGNRWAALNTVSDMTQDDFADAQRQHEAVSRESEYAARSVEELIVRHHLTPTEIVAIEDGGEAGLRQRRDRVERTLRRRTLAAELARQTRERIIRRVLPETEVYMRALLPELTMGRYRDVELLRTEGENSATAIGAELRIRVWDETAGRYVAKNLFSGGARDQFSLALRLAFALATLPKELGAMPGFMFLDEPLSAFDAERSEALAHLLTEGAIGQQFAQVLLISHSRIIDPRGFAYHVRMSGGRVVASDLPSVQTADAIHASPHLPPSRESVYSVQQSRMADGLADGMLD